MELDHVFVRTTFNAPEADLLRQFGLTEGSGNTHPGQGTANRRFFFHNAFLEFLWISDAEEIQSEQTRRTQLLERLNGDSADVSPFGICFRSPLLPPFPAWAYKPAYLPEGMQIGISEEAPLSEPMWFFLNRGMPPTNPPEHAAGVRDISAIAITMPRPQTWSKAAMSAMETGKITLHEGGHHLMEITFDNGASSRRHDFRPTLPLVFNY